jgi:hypothetical protein
MDRPLLNYGVTRASKSRNNTVIKKLNFTDVMNAFKASTIVSKYSRADPRLPSTHFSLFVIADGVNPLLDIKHYCLLNKDKPIIFDGEKAKNFSQNKSIMLN